MDREGLLSVSVGELGGGWCLMMVGEVIFDAAMVDVYFSFKSRLGEVVD